jgi:hypothetical protein
LATSIGTASAASVTVVIEDPFSGPPLDTTKLEVSTTGLGHYWIMDWQVPGRSSLVLMSGYGGSGSALVRSRAAFSLTTTPMIIFEGMIGAYSEDWYPGVYGDKQPRGLRVGTDPNNAIEFISYARDTVEVRTVASGIATTTQYVLPPGKTVYDFTEYRIEATSSSVKSYVDDVLIATHTTNIPTGPLNLYMGTSYEGYGNVPVGADWLYLAIVEDVGTIKVDVLAPARFPAGSPFVVMAKIRNCGDTNVDDVKATIHLPAGLELVWPEKDIMYGRIWPNTCLAYCWLVKTDTPGDYCIEVTAEGKACGGDTVIGSDQHLITIWDWR